MASILKTCPGPGRWPRALAIRQFIQGPLDLMEIGVGRDGVARARDYMAADFSLLVPPVYPSLALDNFCFVVTREIIATVY